VNGKLKRGILGFRRIMETIYVQSCSPIQGLEKRKKEKIEKLCDFKKATTWKRKRRERRT